MLVDVNPIVLWVSLIISVITLAGMLKTYFSSGEKELTIRLAKFEEELAERLDTAEASLRSYDRRIQAVESEVNHMPTQESVHKLQVDLTEMKGSIAVMAKSSEVTERTTRRVEEFLLRQKD